jgi:hypothetical protein
MDPGKPDMQLSHSFTIDSLGACQGISWLHGKAYLYGDREVGMTGLAVHGKDPVFMGNSVLLDKATNRWKAVIYCIDWPGLQRTGTLDNGNLLNVIDDDACIQGTRPEYVEYGHKWYVATADYGNKGNEVRLYDPAVLQHAAKTTDKGVVRSSVRWIISTGEMSWRVFPF